MPRKKRQESPTGVYHWIVRGTNKKDLFHDTKDFRSFEDLLFEYKSEYSILIYHYCLMSNHVHMLVHAEDLDALAGFSHYVQRRYAYYYCKRYGWNGCVFQKGYKSLVIDREEYLLECGRYIERNPLRSRIVKTVEDYLFSSFQYYSKGESDKLLTPSPAFLVLSGNNIERRIIYSRRVKETRIQEEMAAKGLFRF
jgi:putative transposase